MFGCRMGFSKRDLPVAEPLLGVGFSAGTPGFCFFFFCLLFKNAEAGRCALEAATLYPRMALKFVADHLKR